MILWIFLLIAAFLKVISITLAVLIGILWTTCVKKEGMNENTTTYSWFEPEGYGTTHSMINPKIKPLMYKYVY